MGRNSASQLGPAGTDEIETLMSAARASPAHLDGSALSASQRIISILASTPSSEVRNAAALALVDLGCGEAARTINTVLAREDVARSAGSLVYALDELGGSVSLKAISNILMNGSYEARAELLFLLEDGRVEPYDDREWKSAKSELSDLASREGEASESVHLALHLLRDR